jgi:hypothetical protein
MSDRTTSQFPLLCLPRELRNLIFTYSFQGSGLFLKNWGEIDTLDTSALSAQLPGVCQVTRQLFHEATSIFLNNCYSESCNTQTSRILLHLYSQFPDIEATKDPKLISIYDWKEKALRSNHPNEQGLWRETGLHYEPAENRSIEKEKTILAKDSEAFIAT